VEDVVIKTSFRAKSRNLVLASRSLDFARDDVVSLSFMNVVFDFDNTLFQTERLKQALYVIVEERGFSHDEAVHIYLNARQKNNEITFSIVNFCDVLNVAIDKNKTSEHVTPSFIRNELFQHVGLVDGAMELLSLLKKHDIAPHLLSLGVSEWQHEKVALAKLDTFFDPVHIVYTSNILEGKVDALRLLFGIDFDGADTYLFNDKPDETKNILDAFPKLRVYLRRDSTDTRYTKEDFDVLVKTYGDRVMYADDLNQGADFLHLF